MSVRAAIKRKEKQQKDKFVRDYDIRVADGLANAEQLKRNELAYNMSMAQLEHVRDELTMRDHEESQGFATSISNRETMTGRQFAASRH